MSAVTPLRSRPYAIAGDTAAQTRFLRAAARGAPAAELDALHSRVKLEHILPRLQLDLARLRRAVAHCPEPRAHVAHDLLRAAVDMLLEVAS